jgi:aspartate/methionine/tyrosine aminotransferase
MTPAKREPTPPHLPDTRSPFARLNELVADVSPGQPPIALSVGEPQHPVPPFVGPVLAGCIDEFGRYPINKGIDAFRAAAAGWLNRRYELARGASLHHGAETRRC